MKEGPQDSPGRRREQPTGALFRMRERILTVADPFELASESVDPRWLRRRVLAWFDAHGRDFPWRERRDPYRVLIAEILLQRTRADLVRPAFEEFIARYPNAASLAAAKPSDVIRLLRPLG